MLLLLIAIFVSWCYMQSFDKISLSQLQEQICWSQGNYSWQGKYALDFSVPQVKIEFDNSPLRYEVCLPVLMIMMMLMILLLLARSHI